MGAQERKEREKQQRRNEIEILTAADKVSFAKRLHNATMNEVAEEALQQSLQRREKLEQAGEVIKISQHQKGMARSGFLPGIAAVVDYGYEKVTADYPIPIVKEWTCLKLIYAP